MNRDLKTETDNILRRLIYPFFKELGFRKSGNVFNRRVNDLLQMVDVQKSQWNSQDSSSFTLNIGFFNEEVHRELGGETIPKVIRSYDTQVHLRLGFLVRQKDYWYELNESTSYEDVYNELQVHLEVYLKPMLNNLQTLASVIDFVEGSGLMKISMSPTCRIILLIKGGQKEKAQAVLRAECNKRNSSAVYIERLMRIASANGLSWEE